ncbi:unnamed protein product [Schistosoma margrebowiei]|uniref:Uncharacterized protein n=1 Tax=Schistosoma margrebowiei TaxID=48269 RepID=A0AA85ALK9_9TREM|nr:unnamed protein product [Schistosoma margrebowiei]
MQTNKSRTISLLTLLIILLLIINYWELIQARKSKSSTKTIVKHNTIHKTTINKHSNKQPTIISQQNQRKPQRKQYNYTYKPLQNIQPFNAIKRQLRTNMIRDESQSIDTHPSFYKPYEALNNYQQYNNDLNEEVPIDEQVGYILQLEN